MWNQKAKISIISPLLAALALLCLPAVCSAEDNIRPETRPCAAYSPHNFKSAAAYTDGAEKLSINSTFRRSAEERSGSVFLAASGHVSAASAGKSVLRKAENTVELGNECLAPGPYEIEDILKFGLPAAWEPRAHEKGDFWMADIIIAGSDAAANVTVSYSLDDVAEMAGVRVAKVGVLLNGSDAAVRGGKARWGGAGYEIWNMEEGFPIVRVLEVKMGRSFQDKAEMRFEYAESFID